MVQDGTFPRQRSAYVSVQVHSILMNETFQCRPVSVYLNVLASQSGYAVKRGNAELMLIAKASSTCMVKNINLPEWMHMRNILLVASCPQKSHHSLQTKAEMSKLHSKTVAQLVHDLQR